MERSMSPTALMTRSKFRACQNCVRAKAKCIPGPDGGGCERCLRLKKLCVFEPPKARKRKPPKTTRVAQLEDKLDGLVMLIKSTQQQALPQDLPALSHSVSTGSASSFSEPSPPDPSQHEHGHSTFLEPQVPAHATCFLGLGAPHMDPAPPPPVERDSSLPPEVRGRIPKHNLEPVEPSPIIDYHPTPEEEEECVETFRTSMRTYFPFLPLPATVTSASLRASRPVFHQAIVAVALRHPAAQIGLGRKLMSYLSERIVVHGERNLDLLCAVLAYAGFCHFHFHSRPQLTNLASLALGLVWELRVNKPLLSAATGPGGPLFSAAHAQMDGEGGRGLSFEGTNAGGGGPMGSCPRKNKEMEERGGRTLEEMRVVLGVYFFTSIVSTYFQKIDPLRWTPYLVHCVNTISISNEYPTDASIAPLIKLRRINEAVVESPWHEAQIQNPDYGASATHNHGSAQAQASTETASHDSSHISGHGAAHAILMLSEGKGEWGEWEEGIKPPPNYYLKALKARLDDVMSKHFTRLGEDPFLHLQIHTTELSISSLGLAPYSTFPTNPLSTFSTNEFPRLPLLYSTLQSLASFFSIFLSLPPASYPSFSLITFSILAQSLVTLHRLSTLKDPEWDSEHARRVLDFGDVVNRLIARFEEVVESLGGRTGGRCMPDETDVFSRTCRKLLKVREWWEGRLAAEAEEAARGAGAAASAGGGGGGGMEGELQGMDASGGFAAGLGMGIGAGVGAQMDAAMGGMGVGLSEQGWAAFGFEEQGFGGWGWDGAWLEGLAQ